MKRTLVFVMSVLLALSVIGAAGTAFAADASDNLILQLTETHTDNQIIIDVNLTANTGVSAMTLELAYDKTVFTFTGYDKGTALGGLDLMSTDLSGDSNLPVKFNWFNQNLDVDNDFSTGKLLRLYFTLKPDSEGGKSEIGFKYDPQSDIVYVDRASQKVKTAAIGKAVVNVGENKIADIEIQNVKASGTGVSLVQALIIALSVTAVAGVVTAIVVKTRKKRRKKKSWLRL